MQVSNDTVYSVIKAYLSQQAKETNNLGKAKLSPSKSTPAGVVDSMELSDQAKKLSFALKAVHDTPDIREDLVNALIDKIAKGTYSVSGEEIAEKIIGRAVVDELI